MGSRTLPYECEHGVTLDWGDFGPDPNDGRVGAGVCWSCHYSSKSGLLSWAADELIHQGHHDLGEQVHAVAEELSQRAASSGPDTPKSGSLGPRAES